MANKGHGKGFDTRLEMILEALEGLEYGTLNIIVHESQITQIERTEKKRFPLEKTAASKERLLVERARQGG
ncbi:YezD family protein [Brevibacillus borstelensis]|uniref:YezD family protein n=1 Tax=Brevibacillus borstelensis TaxID=45462 RepID=UPI0030C2E113